MSKVLSSILLLTASGILWTSGCASSETQTGTHSQGSDASAGSNDAAAPPGSCDIMYCPHDGFGTACCVTANGPCGYDMGQGCIANTTGNADGG